MCNRIEYPDRTWRCKAEVSSDVTSFGLWGGGYLYKPTPGCMASNLSIVCVLGALAGTSGQGTNSIDTDSDQCISTFARSLCVSL